LLLFDGEGLARAGVEVAQRYRDFDVHVAAALHAASAEVAATEEAGEEVEGIVVLLVAAALLVLLQSFGAVAVVQLAGFPVR